MNRMTPCELYNEYGIGGNRRVRGQETMCDPRIQDQMFIEVTPGKEMTVRYTSPHAEAHLKLMGLAQDVEDWVRIANEFFQSFRKMDI